MLLAGLVFLLGVLPFLVIVTSQIRLVFLSYGYDEMFFNTILCDSKNGSMSYILCMLDFMHVLLYMHKDLCMAYVS